MTHHPSCYWDQNLGVILILLFLTPHPVCQEILIVSVSEIHSRSNRFSLPLWLQAIIILYQVSVHCLQNCSGVCSIWVFLVASLVRNQLAVWETQVQSLDQEDLEKEMATYSSTLAWKIPWMEEPGRLQSMGLQRVGHDWVTSRSFFLSDHMEGFAGQ